MGQHAEDAIMAEAMGMDVEDYLLSELEHESEDEDPAEEIQFDLSLILGYLENLKDDDEPPSSAEIIKHLFPKLEDAEAVEFVRLVEKIRHMELEDTASE